MIIKIVGAVLVIFSSSFIGLFYAKLDKYRITSLLEMKKAMTILRGEIEFSYSPLPVAFSSISQRVSGSVGSFFSHIGVLLNKEKTDTLSSLWNQALGECFNKSYFINEDIEAFKSFGTTLGFLDRQMQTASIGLVLEYIDSSVSELSLLCEKKSKLYQSLGLLGGLLIAVLFI